MAVSKGLVSKIILQFTFYFYKVAFLHLFFKRLPANKNYDLRGHNEEREIVTGTVVSYWANGLKAYFPVRRGLFPEANPSGKLPGPTLK